MCTLRVHHVYIMRAYCRAGTLDYMAPEILTCPDKTHPFENKERSEIAYGAQVRGYFELSGGSDLTFVTHHYFKLLPSQVRLICVFPSMCNVSHLQSPSL